MGVGVCIDQFHPMPPRIMLQIGLALVRNEDMNGGVLSLR